MCASACMRVYVYMCAYVHEYISVTAIIALRICITSDPEYLGFPQDGIKVETKPKITVSCLMNKGQTIFED